MVIFRHCKVGLSEFNKYSACYAMVSIAPFVKMSHCHVCRYIGDFHEIFLFVLIPCLLNIFVTLSLIFFLAILNINFILKDSVYIDINAAVEVHI